MKDTKCNKMKELITESLAGGLNAQDTALMSSHLSECTGCSKYMETMKVIINASKSIKIEAPDFIETRVMAVIESENASKKPVFAHVLRVGASFAAVVFAATFLIYNNISDKQHKVEMASFNPSIIQADKSAQTVKVDIKKETVQTAALKETVKEAVTEKTSENYEKNVLVYEYRPAPKKEAVNQPVPSVNTAAAPAVSTGVQAAKDPGVEPTPSTPLLDDEKAIIANNLINPNLGQAAAIKIKVDETSRVKIVIYDKAVREVAKLVDEDKAPGAYQIMWYGKNDNSEVVREGIYFVYIQIGRRVIKKNIIVSKN
jgi:hypothetical protein